MQEVREVRTAIYCTEKKEIKQDFCAETSLQILTYNLGFQILLACLTSEGREETFKALPMPLVGGINTVTATAATNLAVGPGKTQKW